MNYNKTPTDMQVNVKIDTVKEIAELKSEIKQLKEIVERLRGELYFVRRGL